MRNPDPVWRVNETSQGGRMGRETGKVKRVLKRAGLGVLLEVAGGDGERVLTWLR